MGVDGLSPGPLAPGSRVVIVGGAGFVGSHFVDRLLGGEVGGVTIYDNFSSGRAWHFQHHAGDPRLQVVRADVRDLPALTAACAGHQALIHLASNPDIARAVREPDIDFRQGTELTRNVAEAVRQAGVELVLYASGSGVYGELGEIAAREDHGPLRPVSTYGASKLAGEALLCSYSHLFGFKARAFRFGNVVGPRQTHGVGFDFVRKLLADPDELEILGDGRQSKSYIHIDDVVDAVLAAAGAARVEGADPFDVFNVATGDYVTVTEIGRLAAATLGLDPGAVRFRYTGGDRGWQGDVPVVRLDTERIRGLGWRCRLPCREALSSAMDSLIGDFRAGRMAPPAAGAGS